jgi:hypothetical protein
LSIELRANYRITEKSIGLEGFSPPIASWLVDYLLTISANRSLNQPSSKQFAVSTHACMLFFGQRGEFDVHPQDGSFDRRRPLIILRGSYG